MAEATLPPKRKRTALYVLIAVLLLAAAAGAAAFVLVQNKRLSQFEGYAFATGSTDPQAAADADPYTPGAASRHVFVPFDMFTSNLAGSDADRFIQVGVTLEVKDDQHRNGVSAVMPVLRSEVLLLLSSRRVAELSTLEGKQQLARDILDITRRHVSPGLDRGIYAAHFSNFVIQ